MEKCEICGYEADGINILYIANKSNDIKVCSRCSNNINILIKSKDQYKKKTSENYLFSYTEKINNEKVLNYVKHIIENSASNKNQQDNITNQNSTSGWITGMKIIAWITFVSVIIGGFILSAPFWKYEAGFGFVILLISCVVAFISIGFIMIFLDIAEDIKDIRNNIKNKK